MVHSKMACSGQNHMCRSRRTFSQNEKLSKNIQDGVIEFKMQYFACLCMNY